MLLGFHQRLVDLWQGRIDLALDLTAGAAYQLGLQSTQLTVKWMLNRADIDALTYLTSGSKEYVSDGIRGQHSPFARKFLEALKTNCGEDRLLTLAELMAFIGETADDPSVRRVGK